MTVREQRRARVLSRILMGELTMAEGSTELGLSERQLWRLRAAFIATGPAGLVHGNRGRASALRIDPARRARIVELRERYGPINDTHFGELLAEREGRSRPAPGDRRTAGRSEPRAGHGDDPLDTTARPSLETGHPRQQAREATDRITRQLT